MTTDTPLTGAYYAGKGCECSARSRSECGCDVDWTDPRIYELQAEVEELKKGKVFVDPKWIYDLEAQLAKAHEELCQAGLREYGV